MFSSTKILLLLCVIFVNITQSVGQTQRIFCNVCSCRGKYISCARGLPSLHRILKATRTGNSVLLVRSDFSLYKTFKKTIDRLFESVILLDGSRETAATLTTPASTTLLHNVFESTLAGKRVIEQLSPTHTPEGGTRKPQSGLHDSPSSASMPTDRAYSEPIDGLHSSHTPPNQATPILSEPRSLPTTGVRIEKEAVTIEGMENVSSTPAHSEEHPDVQASFLNYYTLCALVIGIIAGILLTILLRYLWIYCAKNSSHCRAPASRGNPDIAACGDIIEMNVF